MDEEYKEFRIYFQWPDGTDDSIVISGDTRAERLDAFNAEMQSRNATCTGQERIA